MRRGVAGWVWAWHADVGEQSKLLYEEIDINDGDSNNVDAVDGNASDGEA